MLHERFPCVGILEGYTIDMGAMGSFCPAHVKEVRLAKTEIG